MSESCGVWNLMDDKQDERILKITSFDFLASVSASYHIQLARKQGHFTEHCQHPSSCFRMDFLEQIDLCHM